MTKWTEKDCYQLEAEAHAAGLEAATDCAPTPMTVFEADGLSSDPKPGGKSWFVADGVCGVAWVNIRPARGAFVNYLKKKKKGHKSYTGGWDYWVSEFGQSYERKMAYARAFAKVLNDAGLKTYPMGRLD